MRAAAARARSELGATASGWPGAIAGGASLQVRGVWGGFGSMVPETIGVLHPSSYNWCRYRQTFPRGNLGEAPPTASYLRSEGGELLLG
jgi:hypothetical protein